MKLKDLDPCRYSERIGSTTRKEWDKSSRDAMWLVGKSHEKGSMSRRTLVGLMLKTIEPIFSLMPEVSRNCMASLQKWVDGDSVDLIQIREETPNVQTAEAARAAADAAAAYTAAYVAYAADAAAARAVAVATADAAKISVQIDVRKHITCEECCSYLGIDPDEVLD